MVCPHFQVNPIEVLETAWVKCCWFNHGLNRMEADKEEGKEGIDSIE